MLRNIAVIGGDLRQRYLTEFLKAEGYEATHVFGFEGQTEKDCLQTISNADGVILPLPLSRDNITLNCPLFGESILLTHLAPAFCDKIILTGGTSTIFQDVAKVNIDYSDRADFKIRNGLATAEGALALAINNTNRTLAGSRALVIGYGFIGKPLSRMLDSLGVVTTASARKVSDLALIETNGLDGIHTNQIGNIIGECDLIFNTVPTAVVGTKELACCKKDALIIELASRPGGIDTTSAKRLGIRVLEALGIPGKISPVSAANYIKETVINIFEEMAL